MRIEIVTTPSSELAAAMRKLVPQLSRSNPPPTEEELDEILASPATDFFVATDDDGEIVGVATLVTFRIPTGMRAWIEDVVVDAGTRGSGTGQALTEAMLDRARELGCVTVDLTSRPSREAANRLYQRAGFVLRDTNVYRRDLKT